MEAYLEIFKSRSDKLIQISINERKDKGDGILFLNFTNNEKLDVYFIEFYDKENDCINHKFPKNMVDYFKEKMTTLPNSVIFFNLYDDKENLNIELDLNTHNQENANEPL